jgi:hemerythrin superfamily protein
MAKVGTQQLGNPAIREIPRTLAEADYRRPESGRLSSMPVHNYGSISMATITKRRAAPRSKAMDAIALLKTDHRQVEEWFSQFEKTKSESKKQRLADSICHALTIHTTIEEEIFYPAFIEATGDKDIHHEAVVEHDGAKKLIAEIQDMSAGDDYFDAKVTVLSEMIKHHVKEEEQPGGMFAEARKSDMDLAALGEQLLARKQELQGQSKAA